MAEPRRTLAQTIKGIAKLKHYFEVIVEHNGSGWQPELESTARILKVLESSEPSGEKIKSIIESSDAQASGTGWYEVRTMIWLWEDAVRGERP
jgi:hypothetical protein